MRHDNETRHGSPHDRGRADAWYGRDPVPHCFEGASFMSVRIDIEEMSAGEIQSYQDGYYEQLTTNERKEW